MNEEQFTAFLNVVQASLSSISIQAPAIPGAAAGQSNGESNPDGSSSTSSSTWRILNFEQYDGKEKFCQYVERFENFAGLRGISNDSLLMKSTLINCLGSETYQLLKAISAPKELKDLSYKDIIASLSQHLSPPPNKLLEQHRFLSRLQKDTETIGEYVAALRSFLENSEFKCTCGKSIADMFLRAQFIRGIKSSFIRERLLCESELTFERAVNMALSLESSKLDNQEILNGSASTTGVTSVCKIHSSKPSSSHNSRYRSRNKSEQRYQRSDSRHSKRGKSAKRRIDYEKLGISDLCIRCGRNNHRAFDCKVNPSSLKCFSCSKTGHISKVCISTLLTQNRSHKVNAVNDEYPDVNDIVDFSSNPDCFLLSSDPFYSEDDDTGKYIASVDINGFETQFEVDSGCGYTLLPENQFLKLDPRIKLFPARQNFKSYDHGIIKPIGYAKAAVTFNNITAYVPFYVVPSKFSAILGRSWIRRFQINLNELSTQKPSSKEDFSSVHRITVQDIQQQFPDICVQKVGKIPDLKCSLPLKSNAKPKFQKPRDPPYALKKPVDNELDDLERDDIITRTDTSDWGSPLVPVPKTVEKVRLCVDYKSGVNPQLEDFHYPIPRIEELISELKESSVYCKIDLYKAYLHVEMDDEAKKIQAISTHRGTYLMNRLSLGIKTAPSQFHQILGRLLAGLSGIIWYFDDIIVHGKNYDECYKNLIALLKRLQEKNLHINLSKCHFFKDKIAYLGYIIQGRNVYKDPRKISDLLQTVRPQNRRDVMQFLGLVTYYSRFVPNASTLTAPLRQLLSKNHPFKWSDACEKAFLKLKEIIASDHVLVSYDVNLPITVACDASPTGLGAVISHIIDGSDRPIMFASRSLTPAEKNYSQLDREALSIVFALDKYYMYIYGRKFTLITDNKPLSRILHQNKKLPPMTAARLLRYAAYLSSFDYEVKHRLSKAHANVDYLSRFPVSGRNLQGNQPLLDFELSACHENTLNQISSANVTSYDIAEAAESDPKLVDIISKLRSSSEDPACMEYVLEGDIVYRGNRVYIPQSLRGQILKELHETHSGITKTKQLARRYVYWPSIDSDIEKLIKSCEQCMLSQKSPKKVPTHKWEEPTQNFSRVHMDYAGPRKGFNFLILVDAKSKWPEVRILSKAPTTDSTIKLLEDIFSFHGYPQTLVSDNASIFSADNAEFSNYCKTKGIFHCFTAPGKPATNGLAERYVQILKSKLSKMEAEPGDIQEKVRQIVLRFRATPLLDGSSPAERYLGRRIKLRLDAIHPFKPLKNSSCQATHLRSFQIGDKIIARVYRSNKPSWQPGLVRKKFGKIHYLVELSNGYTLKRHIDQLRDASFLDFKTPEQQQSKPKKQVSFQVQMPTPRDIPDLHVVPSGRQVVIPVAKPASPGSPSASRKPPTVQGSSSHLVRQPLPLTSHGSLPSPVSLPSTSQSANQDVPPPVIDLTSQTPRKLPSVGRGRATIRSPVLDRPSRIKKVPGHLKDFVPK